MSGNVFYAFFHGNNKTTIISLKKSFQGMDLLHFVKVDTFHNLNIYLIFFCTKITKIGPKKISFYTSLVFNTTIQ